MKFEMQKEQWVVPDVQEWKKMIEYLFGSLVGDEPCKYADYAQASHGVITVTIETEEAS